MSGAGGAFATAAVGVTLGVALLCGADAFTTSVR